ncbi:TlpA family protein disulfide reductase [Gimesia aquarii]|uniref:Thiol-disulfide oxidoreductase ResA n=1 Tax=Gimesia aquarii TaxID=2527964 RepID=A0A517WXF5_9PLAN|nr:TlpA disulfide reductase family protein [Gimesia aquarii]QDU09928.1 Thiol-disulfide oxidoreductase ResA [Gimesia aquarii]
MKITSNLIDKYPPGKAMLMYAKSICLLLSVVLLSSCNQEVPSESKTVKTETTSEPMVEQQQAIPGAQTFEEDGITAEIASWGQLQEFIAKQKGKIVVVDLWSTWCEPCLREFPHLVELQKKYPEKIVCVSFNMNYDGSKNSPPESNREELMEFFTEQKADIVNIISSTPDEELYESINLAAIPAAYVYSPDGKLKKRFDNETLAYGQEGFTYNKHIVPLIDEMLQKPQK